MSYYQSVWLVIAGVYAGLLLVSCVVGAIAWDVYAYAKGLPQHAQVSYRTWFQSQRHLAWTLIVTGMLAFACGVLVGHLFLPQFIER